MRDLPDWDPEPEDDTDACAACRRGHFGCTCLTDEEREEQEAEYQAKREANLKRWGLLPPGKGIETRRVA
jgi:hypothetical protein